MLNKDRRRFQRIRPAQPLSASVGSSQAYVLDASIGGVGLIHENVLPAPGDIVRIEMNSEVGRITLDCEVVRTAPHTAPQGTFGKPMFQSGLRVVAADHQSAERLRAMFGASAAKRTLRHDN